MTSPALRTRRRRWLLPTLDGYQSGWIGADVVAGLSAGAVVVPQAMAYATIANLPVQVGLYTCIVPMAVYALLGGSKAMSVSTTSTIATLTATTLVTVGITAGSGDPLGTVITLTLMVGLILLGLRLLKLGSLIENISSATILGVQVGVGATVAVGQLPKLLGVDSEYSGHGFIRSLIGVAEALPHANTATILLSAGSILVLVLLQRFVPRIPAALVVVVGGILLVAFGGVTEAGIELIDAVPQGLPIPHLPDLTHVFALIPGALGIALMAFLESIAVARGIRVRTDPRIDSNQELLAVSASNIAGSFFTALPAAGGFSQSAVNQAAGARSQLAQLTTVVLAILVALFLGPVLSLLPQATLAALVFVAVLGLVKVGEIVRLARISPVDFWISLTTAVIGLTAGLLAAVATGVVLTLILVLRELNKPRLDIVERRGDAILVHVGRGLYTANVAENARAIEELVDRQEPPVSAIVLDLHRLDEVSLTVLDAMEDLDRELTATDVELHLVRLPDKAAAVAAKLPWYRGLVEAGRAHSHLETAMAAASSVGTVKDSDAEPDEAPRS